MRMYDKIVTQDMRDLADALLCSHVHGLWSEDRARLVADVQALVPDWERSLKWAWRQMLAEAAPDWPPLTEEEIEGMYAMWQRSHPDGEDDYPPVVEEQAAPKAAAGNVVKETVGERVRPRKVAAWEGGLQSIAMIANKIAAMQYVMGRRV